MGNHKSFWKTISSGNSVLNISRWRPAQKFDSQEKDANQLHD